MKTRLICILCLIVVTASVVLIPRISCYRRIRRHGSMVSEAMVTLQSRMVGDVGFATGEGNVFKLIEGDVSSLEKWLNRKHDESLRLDDGYGRFLLWVGRGRDVIEKDPSGKLRLVDSWGQRLVYRCPHDNPAYVCQLYSIGPNGVDEGGKGDDIEDFFSYESISDWFEDPNFDGNVYKKFRGQFTVVTINGRDVIRHP